MTLSTIVKPSSIKPGHYGDRESARRNAHLNGVSASSLERHRASALPTESEHERLVAEFLGDVEATDPTRFAEVCEKYPVRSESSLEDIRAREVSAFAPIDESSDGAQEHGYGERDVDDYERWQATVQAAISAPPLLP